MDGNESKDFTVNVGDWVMFNWGAEGGWMKGEVKRKCTSTRDIKNGCTHILRHAQLNKNQDWLVALKETNYIDGSNQPGQWAFIRKCKWEDQEKKIKFDNTSQLGQNVTFCYFIFSFIDFT